MRLRSLPIAFLMIAGAAACTPPAAAPLDAPLRSPLDLSSLPALFASLAAPQAAEVLAKLGSGEAVALPGV